MEQGKHDVDLGHFLSLALRHQPAAYLKLNANGWVDVSMNCWMAAAGHASSFSMEALGRIA